MKWRIVLWIVFLGSAAAAIGQSLVENLDENSLSSRKKNARPLNENVGPVRLDLQSANNRSHEVHSSGPVVHNETLEAVRLAIDKLENRKATGAKVDLFSSSSWIVRVTRKPDPIPQPRAEVSSVATAPAIPYKYIGRIDEGKLTRVFLVRGDNVLSASEGETIDNTYRIDAIRGAQMSITYLPLNVVQLMSIGIPQ